MQTFYGILILVRFVYSVPPDYCLFPLNGSDCNLEPTPVFSYYKPGSRCEIYFWRGCPTLNKFDDEYECSNQCIFRLDGGEGMSEEDLNIVTPPTVDQCTQPLNTTNCTNEEKIVFTFRNGACFCEIWRGCPTTNKFDDEQTCKETCEKARGPKTLEDWKIKLKGLDAEKVKDIDNLLEDALEDTAAMTTKPAATVSSEVPEATTVKQKTQAATEDPTTTPEKLTTTNEETTTDVPTIASVEEVVITT